MATCFDNLIAIKSTCNGVTGTSGLFIEDIGITAQEAGMYINSEYVNGADLITDKIRFATEIVRKTISNHFASHIISKSLIDSQLLGQYQSNLLMKPGAVATLGGISLTLNNTQSYYTVFVNEISLQVDVTQDINVLVYDLISGILLDTIVVSAVANKIVSKTVNKTYSSPKRKLDLIFVYDTEGINSNTTQIYSSGINGSCLSCSGYKYANYYISASAVNLIETDTKIRSSLVSSQHTYGLSVNYSIQCSIENWLCEIANLMAMPILYRAGMEVMQYALLHSNRQNSNVNIDSERNQKFYDFCEKEYISNLESTIKKINLPKYDPCFKCNEAIKHAVILP